MNEIKPLNLFFTKHCLSVLGVFYMTTLSPTIDKIIEGNLSKKDIAFLINSTLAAAVGASLKGYDSNVYTPKFMPGRNKDQAIDNINNTITNVVNNTVTDQIVNTVMPSNNPIQKEINTNITSNIVDNILTTPINNTINNLGDLFKTKDETNKMPITITSVDTNKNLLINNKQTINIVLTNNKLTYYKKELVDSSKLSNDKKIIVEPNTVVYIDSYVIDTISNHIGFTINDTRLFAYIPDISLVENGKQISLVTDIKGINNTNYLRPTIDECNELYDTTLTEAEYKDLINCLNTFGINTPKDVSMFLSQCGHESAGLRYNKEIASGDDYEYREDLGNIYPGDGRKFKGSGFIQLTGRFNFTSFSEYINDPKVIEIGSDYVADKYPFSSAGWFWKHNGLSDYINNEGADIYAVTKIVNGGYTNMEDRIFYFDKAKRIFNIT